MSTVIECQGLGVNYGDFSALRDFDLQLPTGRAAVLVGPNGAGKSSCLKVLAGLESESFGRVEVLGQRPKSAPRSWRAQMGVMPEHLGLFDALSIEEHLHLSAGLYGIEKAEAGRRIAE